MGQINPPRPIIKGDVDTWGSKLDTVLQQIIAQGNISDTAITNLTETIQDTVAAMLKVGNGLTLVYDDNAGKLTLSLTNTTPTTLTNSVAPSITGSTTVGSVLTAANGTWSPTPDSFAYAWRRAGSNIAGATSQTYTLVAADAGNAIGVVVTAKKSGYTDASIASASITATAATATNYLLTEAGDSLMTEASDYLVTA